MGQTQNALASTLASLGKFHDGLTDFSSRLLREYKFDGAVELIHQILIEPIGGSVKFTSLHRFTVSIGPDFADSREIYIVASVCIEEFSCMAAVAVRGGLGEMVEGLSGPQEILVYEETTEGIELSAAIGFLGKALTNLENLADPLGPLAQGYA
nr:hypothetical protein KitaXyl93_04190 [Kitasatospora sp. Xyl93]